MAVEPADIKIIPLSVSKSEALSSNKEAASLLSSSLNVPMMKLAFSLEIKSRAI